MGLLDKALEGISGAAIGGGLSFLGGERANTASAQSVADQQDFQRETMQNRYQWTMADMRKAGLNPMLAYQQGGGTALSGSNYRAQDTITPGVNSAQAARSVAAQLTKTKQEINTSNAQEVLLSRQRRIAEQNIRMNETLEERSKLEKDVLKTPAGGKAAQAGFVARLLNPLLQGAHSARSLSR